ncbi:terminase small subunit [Clostridium sp. P21]|uniref:Terminase small subunit n=1 Tax=Clostridium muellerianum TaxID=2716538 RepID=A0A7Y0EES9_9CLOT|nr:terminase small subunit [Clostridium muellerianum]NMM62068.1 terminase small subunit [Clostridium muellerianum]
MARLTDKQKKFIDEYLIDLNATQAAIRAGYSQKNAFKIGSELLQKTTVQKHMHKCMKDREKRTEITQDKVLNELAAIGFANIADYLEVKDDAVKVFNTTDIPKEKLRAVVEIKQTKDGISIKIHDKVKALEDIAKHLGMFVDKVEHTGNIGVGTKKLEDFF